MAVVSASTAGSLGVPVNPYKVLRRIWQQRGLLVQLTAREIALRYRGTYLGMLWSLLTPLLILVIYTVVFSTVLKMKWSDADQATGLDQFALTLFAGFIPFTVFAEVVTRAPTVILSVPHYVKKVVFPLEVLPEGVT
jgi:lipopolysaccharide transport system permease protein